MAFKNSLNIFDYLLLVDTRDDILVALRSEMKLTHKADNRHVILFSYILYIYFCFWITFIKVTCILTL